MFAITIMRDESADRQPAEGGAIWIIGNARGGLLQAAACMYAEVIYIESKRCSSAGQTRHDRDCDSRWIATALGHNQLEPERAAAGAASEPRFITHGTVSEASDEVSAGQRIGHAEEGAPWLPLGAREKATSSCPYEGSSPLEFEAPKLWGGGAAGRGTSNSVAGGSSSHTAGQVRPKTAVRLRCSHFCH